jgi:uncharacterized protein (DUF2147 family)
MSKRELMSARRAIAMMALAVAPQVKAAELDGFQGYWRAPDKSVIEIKACTNGVSLCGYLVLAPVYGTDELNPDPALRKRPICGLRVLELQQFSAGVWRQGTAYNPEDGKSYKAALRKRDGRLFLRAYIGTEIFGETETWTAASDFKTGCTP